MALSLKGRALHFVVRVPHRGEASKFYREILGMKALRHEEFAEGCEASCNGLYKDRWSKTMMGYGDEKNHFVIELTYNYGVKSYEFGNDFLGITLKSSQAIQRARQLDWPIEESKDYVTAKAPGGYQFHIINESQPKSHDPIQKVTLACSDLKKTIEYWNGILGLKIFNETENSVTLGFNKNQCLLEFRDIGTTINHAQAYGRIAFAVPKKSLLEIQTRMESENQTILNKLISLDTPGKATVTVVILADPDGHEICFVDEEGFSKLSAVDPKAEENFSKFIRRDRTESFSSN